MVPSQLQVSYLLLHLVDFVGISEIFRKPFLRNLLNFQQVLEKLFLPIDHLINVQLGVRWEIDSLLEVFYLFCNIKNASPNLNAGAILFMKV
jgi:hypothetical protein